jgi:hypothetical protein
LCFPASHIYNRLVRRCHRSTNVDLTTIKRTYRLKQSKRAALCDLEREEACVTEADHCIEAVRTRYLTWEGEFSRTPSANWFSSATGHVYSDLGCGQTTHRSTCLQSVAYNLFPRAPKPYRHEFEHDGDILWSCTDTR